MTENAKTRKREKWEEEAAAVCQDFSVFCNYVLRGDVKLSKQTGFIGKKDCFEINKLFLFKEEYDKPTRFQTRYTIIHYFYYVAVKYRILEINESGTAMRQGINYQIYQEASVLERYILFFVVLLHDRRFAENEYLFGRSMAHFLEWAKKNKEKAGDVSILTSDIVHDIYMEKTGKIMPYLEELRIVKVLKVQKSERIMEDISWEVELLPLLELAADVYGSVHVEDAVSKDELTRCCFEDCLRRYVPEQKNIEILKMFGEAKEEDLNHAIDLEIKTRYTNCVRVIRMNISYTLYDLHDVIQQAFEFDNDHLFAFYVGQGMLKKTYTLEEAAMSFEEESVEETSIGSLGLREGQKFSYLFDFGDMWWFDIKVLKMTEDTVQNPQIIKAVNDAPLQYPDYEEGMEEWQVQTDGKLTVRLILDSIEDELIEAEYEVLHSFSKEQSEYTVDEKRQKIEWIVLNETDKMLTFMTVEMRKLLSILLNEEWIDGYDKCTIAKLYSFGFCMFSGEDDYVIRIPESVRQAYSAEWKNIKIKDKFEEATEVILRRCGVIEMKELYQAVAKLLKKEIPYEDYEILVFGRMHYFGSCYSDNFDGEEILSCYERELTEKILSERQKVENAGYSYPDFDKIKIAEMKEIPEALEKWNEYVKFNLNLDWENGEWIAEQVALMASSGVIEKEQIAAVYKDMIHKQGCRATKKAEKLISELCEALPLAIRKGNTEPGIQQQ